MIYLNDQAMDALLGTERPAEIVDSRAVDRRNVDQSPTEGGNGMARYKGANGQKVVALEGAGRRAEIARLYLRGHTQQEIADALGISQPRVSVLLKELVGQWRREAAEAIADAREQEMAKLQHLETQAWAGFDRSCGKGNKKGKTGDPTWLDLIRRIMELRCKLLGLVSGPSQVNFITVEQVAKAVVEARKAQENDRLAEVEALMEDPEWQDKIAQKAKENANHDLR